MARSTTPYFTSPSQLIPLSAKYVYITTPIGIRELNPSDPILNPIAAVNVPGASSQTTYSTTITNPNTLTSGILSELTKGPSDVTYASTTPSLSKMFISDTTQYSPADQLYYSSTPYYSQTTQSSPSYSQTTQSSPSYSQTTQSSPSYSQTAQTIQSKPSYSQTTPGKDLKNEGEKYLLSLLGNVNNSELEINIEKKYLDLFTEPGNCFTLSNGKKICIPDGVATISLSDKNIKSGFSNYIENFTESIDDTVKVRLQIKNAGDSEKTNATTSKPVADLVSTYSAITKSVTDAGVVRTVTSMSPATFSGTPAAIANPTVNNIVQTNLSESDFAMLNANIEKKILQDIKNSESKIVNNIVSGVNANMNKNVNADFIYTPTRVTTPDSSFLGLQQDVQKKVDTVNNEINEAEKQYKKEQGSRTTPQTIQTTYQSQTTYPTAQTTYAGQTTYPTTQTTYAGQTTYPSSRTYNQGLYRDQGGAEDEVSQSRQNNNRSESKQQQVFRDNTNNAYQTGNISVKPDEKESREEKGKLSSASSANAKVNFPDMPNKSDANSYYGALRSKGGDYAPMNSMTETNKMLSRLSYEPPPLPPNMDFSYFGALKSKGTQDIKPVNAVQGLNNYSGKILDEKLYALANQPGYEQLPIPNRIDYTMSKPEVNMNNAKTFSSQPIDLYSQYGALVSKDGFYGPKR